MQRYSSASMYAGFPMGVCRRPASSLGDPRYAPRKGTQTEVFHRSCVFIAGQGRVTLEDYKQIMWGLNSRLNGYLSDIVKPLKKTDHELCMKIAKIQANRKAPHGRDWDEAQENLKHLRQQITDFTVKNASLLIEVNNAKKKNEDVKTKLAGKINAQKVLQKELDYIKMAKKEIERQKDITKEATDKVTHDIKHIQKEHKEMVDGLCVQISKSKVIVEIEAGDNNLTSTVNKIRCEYEQMVEKKRREMDDWYTNEFEKRNDELNQKTKDLLSLKEELKEKQKVKQQLELTIHGVLSKINVLEGILNDTKTNGLGSIEKQKLKLHSDIMEVRSQFEQKMKEKIVLEMKLNEEIKIYRKLLTKYSDKSLESFAADTVDSDKLNGDVVQQSTK